VPDERYKSRVSHDPYRHGRALFFASRDWMETSSQETQDKLKRLLRRLFASCNELFSQPIDDLQDNEKAVYSMA
jgi:hypothetical protein